MARALLLLFTTLWLFGSLVVWLVTVHDTISAVQCAFITVPPTLFLLSVMLLGRKLVGG